MSFCVLMILLYKALVFILRIFYKDKENTTKEISSVFHRRTI